MISPDRRHSGYWAATPQSPSLSKKKKNTKSLATVWDCCPFWPILWLIIITWLFKSTMCSFWEHFYLFIIVIIIILLFIFLLLSVCRAKSGDWEKWGCDRLKNKCWQIWSRSSSGGPVPILHCPPPVWQTGWSSSNERMTQKKDKWCITYLNNFVQPSSLFVVVFFFVASTVGAKRRRLGVIKCLSWFYGRQKWMLARKKQQPININIRH